MGANNRVGIPGPSNYYITCQNLPRFDSLATLTIVICWLMSIRLISLTSFSTKTFLKFQSFLLKTLWICFPILPRKTAQNQWPIIFSIILIIIKLLINHWIYRWFLKCEMGVSYQRIFMFYIALITIFSSLREFWGRRYNRVVHTVLKESIFEPIRLEFSSSTIGALITFIINGLVHAHICLVTFGAKQTKRYVVDTESQKGKQEKRGALIQIQFIHSTHHSTIILIEANYLSDPQSILFKQIKELCSIKFSNNNEIISWGPLEEEFKNFHHLNLIHIGKNIKDTNLQSLFSDQYDTAKTHPEMEKRDDQTRCISFDIYDTSGDNDIHDNDEEMNDDHDDNYPVQYNSNQPISLQNAIATTSGKFIDKSLTVNHWQCGLDLDLNTWKNQLFSRRQYNKNIEE
ncbi:unnamed protein product [Rotaria sp. Silwood1]|nr:unnamed protein product [Rotaria sp. Silwood1]